MTHQTFATVPELLLACDGLGLEPRTQHGSLGETSYWVYLDGHYYAYWGDDQFLSWGNAYFNRPLIDDEE